MSESKSVPQRKRQMIEFGEPSSPEAFLQTPGRIHHPGQKPEVSAVNVADAEKDIQRRLGGKSFPQVLDELEQHELEQGKPPGRRDILGRLPRFYNQSMGRSYRPGKAAIEPASHVVQEDTEIADARREAFARLRLARPELMELIGSKPADDDERFAQRFVMAAPDSRQKILDAHHEVLIDLCKERGLEVPAPEKAQKRPDLSGTFSQLAKCEALKALLTQNPEYVALGGMTPEQVKRPKQVDIFFARLQHEDPAITAKIRAEYDSMNAEMADMYGVTVTAPAELDAINSRDLEDSVAQPREPLARPDGIMNTSEQKISGILSANPGLAQGMGMEAAQADDAGITNKFMGRLMLQSVEIQAQVHDALMPVSDEIAPDPFASEAPVKSEDPRPS